MTYTVRQFRLALENLKPELQDTEIVIIAPNGLELYPKLKFQKKELGNMDLTKKNVKAVIVSY